MKWNGRVRTVGAPVRIGRVYLQCAFDEESCESLWLAWHRQDRYIVLHADGLTEEKLLIGRSKGPREEKSRKRKRVVRKKKTLDK